MNPLDIQVGGSHYKNMKIQPLEFFIANNVPYAEAAACKYVIRYKDKGQREDLEKAKHIIDVLIQVHYPDAPVTRDLFTDFCQTLLQEVSRADAKHGGWDDYTLGACITAVMDETSELFDAAGRFDIKGEHGMLSESVQVAATAFKLFRKLHNRQIEAIKTVE